MCVCQPAFQFKTVASIDVTEFVWSRYIRSQDLLSSGLTQMETLWNSMLQIGTSSMSGAFRLHNHTFLVVTIITIINKRTAIKTACCQDSQQRVRNLKSFFFIVSHFLEASTTTTYTNATAPQLLFLVSRVCCLVGYSFGFSSQILCRLLFWFLELVALSASYSEPCGAALLNSQFSLFCQVLVTTCTLKTYNYFSPIPTFHLFLLLTCFKLLYEEGAKGAARFDRSSSLYRKMQRWLYMAAY